MKIDFNPQAAAQAQNARGPQTQSTPPAPDSSDGGVTITLSQTAKQMLKGDAAYDGESPAQQARAAMLNISEGIAVDGLTEEDLSKPFGQIVKMFAHAKHAPETEDALPVDGGETGATTDTGETTDTGGTTETGDTGDTGDTGTTEGGDTTVTDGTGDTGDTGTTEGDGTTVAVAPEEGDGSVIGETDPIVVVQEPDITEILDETAPTDGETTEPASGTTDGDGTTVVVAPEEGDGSVIGEVDPIIVVQEPDITEILDETAPTDGETTEPDSGLAGSGDAVASTGDGGATTGTTETGEPVAVVDSGDVTDVLLDQLDENGEEVV